MGIVFNQALSKADNVQFTSLSLGNDTKLKRDSANTFAMRNGTNEQQFNIYNTYTDASNYERLEVKWDANVAEIESTAAGTGSNRAIRILSSSSMIQVGGGRVDILAGGSANFYATSTANLVYKTTRPAFDSSVDLGTSSERWATTYADDVIVTNSVAVGELAAV